jgi:DNA-binding CsgD family transcriptional regulator
MIGRDAELDRLCAIATDVSDGRGGGALVTGEAGIGKSRLVTEFARVARLRGLLVVVGHGVELAGGHLPFGSLADTVRDAVRQLGRQELERLAPAACRALAPIVPALAGSSGSFSSGAVASAQAPSADRVSVLGGAIHLLDALTAERPVCWVVEDLQWTDPQTRDLLAIVSHALGSRALMVVGSLRTPLGESEAASLVSALASRPEVTTIRLGRLDEASARRQLRRVHGAAMDASTEERILRLGEGLPLFIEHLAIEAGDAPTRVPESLGAIVDERLRRLGEGARAVVEAASVADGPTDAGSLAMVTGWSPEAVGAAVDEAAAARVLELDDEGRLLFVHTLVKDWVASRLLPTRRQALHRHWADALDTRRPEYVAAVVASALHRRAAGEPEGALRRFGRAAVLAAASGDSQLETSCLLEVRGLWDAVADPVAAGGMGMAEVLFHLCIAATSAGQEEALRAVLREELARGHLASTGIQRLWLQVRLEQAEHRAPPAPVEPIVRDRAGLLLEAEPSLTAHDALQITGRWARRFDGALAARLHRRALDMARELHDPRARMRSEVFVGFDHLARVEPLEEARRLLALEDELAALAVADWSMVVESAVTCLVDAGSYTRATAIAEEALVRLQNPGLAPRRYGGIALALASARAELGDWSGAERWLGAVEAVYEPLRSEAAGIRLRILTRRGRTTEFEPHLSLARATLEPRPDLVGQAHELPDVVAALYAAGNPAEARRWLRTLDGPSDDWWYAALWPAVNAALRFEVTGSGCSTSLADGQLVAHLDRLCATWDWRAPAADAFRAEHAALLARSRHEDSVDHWLAAVDGWVAVGRVWDEAVCRVRLAEAMAAAAAGGGEPAIELERAHDIAGRLDARTLRHEVEAVARRCGVRLPTSRATRASSTGMTVGASLTAREREVLGLVAEGCTNDAIATRLFMSPKTASVHVSRIIAKLGAGNRTEAVAIARRTGLLD